MTSPNAYWLAPHNDIYNRILADLAASPVTGTPAAFLEHRVHTLLAEILDFATYTVDGPSNVTFSWRPQEGATALFWDGAQLLQKPYKKKQLGLGDYMLLAGRIMDIAKDDAVIVDLGAGTALQAIVLRSLGCNAPYVCLDLFENALNAGAMLCRSLGLENIHFRALDLTSAKGISALAEGLREHKRLVVVSRHAIFPYYSRADLERLFDLLIGDLHAAAGVHLERVGRFTPTFQKLQEQFKGALVVSPR